MDQSSKRISGPTGGAVVLAGLLLALPLHADEDPHAQTVEMVNELERDQQQYVQKLLNNPVAQKYLRILSDPQIQQDVHVLVNHPNRGSFLGWEAGFVVFMFIFKAWRLSKSKRVLSVIFTQLWTVPVFLAGVCYFIPRFVFGEDFLRLVSHIYLR